MYEYTQHCCIQSDNCPEVPVLNLVGFFCHYKCLKDSFIFSLPSVPHLLSQLLQKSLRYYSGFVALKGRKASIPLMGILQQEKKANEISSSMSPAELGIPRSSINSSLSEYVGSDIQKIMVQPKYHYFSGTPN